MGDFVIAAILAVVIGVAIAYIVKAKKKGAKCIGCPAGGNCSQKHNKNSGCGCGCGGNEESKCDCHADTKE